MPFYWESTLIPVKTLKTFDTSPIHLHISVQFTISSTLNQTPQISEIYTKSSLPTSLTCYPSHMPQSITCPSILSTASQRLSKPSSVYDQDTDFTVPIEDAASIPLLKVQQWSKNQLWPGTDKCCSVFKKLASSLQCLINHKCCQCSVLLD